jgi:two-component system sensor histidine kinase KdpD
MAAIISNVLDLMRLQSGQFTLRLDWVMMNDLVNSALRRQATQLLGHRVEVCVPTDLPAMRVDGPLLLQVFINLLDNIARHTPAGTQVTVSGNVEESRLRIVIDDTGPGLPPGDPERLFAKFHRGSEESSKGGAGLGLSICRAIVSTHGGQIEAAQRPGGGARFSLSLPLTQTREQ